MISESGVENLIPRILSVFFKINFLKRLKVDVVKLLTFLLTYILRILWIGMYFRNLTKFR